MRKQWDESAIIDAIRQGGRSREEALAHCFQQVRWWTAARRLVGRSDGDKQALEEVFVDSLMALHDQVKREDFQLRQGLTDYFLGIFRKKWFARFRNTRQVVSTEDVPLEMEADTPTVDQRLIDEEQENRYRDVFDQLSPVCHQLLRLTKLDYSDAEIAERMEMKRESVYQQRSRCKRKLYELVNGDADLMEWIREKYTIHGRR